MRYMRFQNEQKGLFTFYKQQQLFQEQVENLRKQRQSPSLVHPQKKKHKQTLSSHRYHDAAKIAQEAERNKSLRENAPVRFKKYGDAVMVIDRKQTQYNAACRNETKRHHVQKDMGVYLQNKKMDFDTSLTMDRKSTMLLRKSPTLNKDQSWRYRSQKRASTKLPSLHKAQQQPLQPKTQPINRSPIQLKTKFGGSMLRSNGTQLLKQILSSRLEGQQNQKQCVSYFEFNRDYMVELGHKKKETLSMQQRRLLQLLGRHRNNNDS